MLAEHDLLTQSDLPVGDIMARAIARDRYGVIGGVERLSGERDHNFLITAPTRSYLLKISHSAERPEVIDFQTAALRHLEHEVPALPIPRVIPDRDGRTASTLDAPHGSRIVRLLSFLPGTALHALRPSVVTLAALGATLAHFDRGLATFHHAAEHHDLMWNLMRAYEVHANVGDLEDPDDRRAVDRALTAFQGIALPALVNLRSQVIHNDVNPHNVLIDPVSGAVSGLIDLGDAVAAPMVNDVAIAAAYQVDALDQPFAGSCSLIAGYHRVLPLTDAEIAVIPQLVAARLAMALTITAWRARYHPANRAYILRNAPVARRGLRQLDSMGTDRAAELIRQALRGSTA
jgi:Ser/Thr protein kinase RdoA (MazF antagonist)